MTTHKSRKSATTAAEVLVCSDARANASDAAKSGSKAAAIIALLKRDGGTTLEQMVERTGWQKHSVRGFMAGALKKRHGLAVISEKTDTGRRYWIAGKTRS